MEENLWSTKDESSEFDKTSKKKFGTPDLKNMKRLPKNIFAKSKFLPSISKFAPFLKFLETEKPSERLESRKTINESK